MATALLQTVRWNLEQQHRQKISLEMNFSRKVYGTSENELFCVKAIALRALMRASPALIQSPNFSRLRYFCYYVPFCVLKMPCY